MNSVIVIVFLLCSLSCTFSVEGRNLFKPIKLPGFPTSSEKDPIKNPLANWLSSTLHLPSNEHNNQKNPVTINPSSFRDINSKEKRWVWVEDEGGDWDRFGDGGEWKQVSFRNAYLHVDPQHQLTLEQQKEKAIRDAGKMRYLTKPVLSEKPDKLRKKGSALLGNVVVHEEMKSPDDFAHAHLPGQGFVKEKGVWVDYHFIFGKNGKGELY